MMKKNELNYRDLKMTCDTNLFKFNTTDELESIDTGIGQDRGIKALEFGLQVDVKGYNLYLEGPSGVGKTSLIKGLVGIYKGTEGMLLYDGEEIYDNSISLIEVYDDNGEGQVDEVIVPKYSKT